MTLDDVFKNLKKSFRLQDSISPNVIGSSAVLSRGIKEEDILALLDGKRIELHSEGKANAAKPFSGFSNEGLKISWNYGSNNRGYLAVILFDGKNFEVNQGHDKKYVSSLDHIHQQHKVAENPYVCRITGDFSIEDIHYLIVRDQQGFHYFSRGLEANPLIKRVRLKGDSIDQSTIFGEYHWLLKDQKIEEEIIGDIPNLEVIYSEVLGEDSIENINDVKRLVNRRDFDPRCESEFRSDNYQFEYNTSSAFLIKWFQKYKIPIIGLNGFEKGELKVINPKARSLTLVGRTHINQVFDYFDSTQVYLPCYDLSSNLPDGF